MRIAGFNGATCKMTWKFETPQEAYYQCLSLQWGHVQNDVEIIPYFGRSLRHEVGFNGATCKMTWK